MRAVIDLIVIMWFMTVFDLRLSILIAGSDVLIIIFPALAKGLVHGKNRNIY